MSYKDNHSEEDAKTVNRRNVLKSIGAAGFVASGFASTTGTAAAQSKDAPFTVTDHSVVKHDAALDEVGTSMMDDTVSSLISIVNETTGFDAYTDKPLVFAFQTDNEEVNARNPALATIPLLPSAKSGKQLTPAATAGRHNGGVAFILVADDEEGDRRPTSTLAHTAKPKSSQRPLVSTEEVQITHNIYGEEQGSLGVVASEESTGRPSGSVSTMDNCLTCTAVVGTACESAEVVGEAEFLDACAAATVADPLVGLGCFGLWLLVQSQGTIVCTGTGAAVCTAAGIC